MNAVTEASLSTRIKVFFTSIPFATRLVGTTCVAFYVVMAATGFDLGAVCISAPSVFHGQVYRIITSTLAHGNLLHLVLNMMALATTGPMLERAFGSLRFLWLMLLFCLLGGLLYTALAALSYPLSPWNLYSQCAVGYSGVLFSLLVVDAAVDSAVSRHDRSLFGLVSVPAPLYPWLLLVFWQLCVPQASFLGHLCGIVVGFAFTARMLDWAQPAGDTITRIERSAACSACMRSSGYIAHTASSGGEPALPLSQPGRHAPPSWLQHLAPWMPFPSSLSGGAHPGSPGAPHQQPLLQQQAPGSSSAAPAGAQVASQQPDVREAAAKAAEARLAAKPGLGKASSSAGGAR